ncbi:MAG: 2-phospho-L-lactate transferase [Pseudomonadota bacterium]|nr:2-phospho-L-lactate transferase [Pseudomonadota bacterium]
MEASVKTYVALTGGVGGAKLCLGLTSLLDKSKVSFIVNTGDDFKHLGLHISPDLDTLMYTLSGESNEDLGWGRKDESWNFLKSFSRLGGDSWFSLGDKDLAVHIMRDRLLSKGLSLSVVTTDLYQRFGIKYSVLPMTDDRVATKVLVKGKEKSFQEYFVKEKCGPIIERVVYKGASEASPSEGIERLLSDTKLSGIIICPSNPFLSIDPILSVKKIKEKLKNLDVPIVAVSPIIAGQSVKGPTSKIMEELGVKPSALGIAEHYGALISGFVLDEADRVLKSKIESLGLKVLVCNTLMKTLDEKVELADNVLQFVSEL